MNGKHFGERGQQIVIGEVAKFGITVAIPLSDNLPFDLLLIIGERIVKAQVKSSSEGEVGECVVFSSFSKGNWYTGESNSYTKNEIDVILGVNLRNNDVYLFDDFEEKKSMVIRLKKPKNKQKKGINLHSDFVLTETRLYEVFGYKPPNLDNYWSSRSVSQSQNQKQYKHICKLCEKEYNNGRKNSKYCGYICCQKANRKVERPNKEKLEEDISKLSWRSIGRKYGVSDNATRKWARSYGLI